MVDWRGASVTGKTLERNAVSDAAHRTPPGKDADGTEINPSPYKVTFLPLTLSFFNNMKVNKPHDCLFTLGLGNCQCFMRLAKSFDFGTGDTIVIRFIRGVIIETTCFSQAYWLL